MCERIDTARQDGSLQVTDCGTALWRARWSESEAWQVGNDGWESNCKSDASSSLHGYEMGACPIIDTDARGLRSACGWWWAKKERTISRFGTADRAR
jgi:hypothetical protein